MATVLWSYQVRLFVVVVVYAVVRCESTRELAISDTCISNYTLKDNYGRPEFQVVFSDHGHDEFSLSNAPTPKWHENFRKRVIQAEAIPTHDSCEWTIQITFISPMEEGSYKLEVIIKPEFPYDVKLWNKRCITMDILPLQQNTNFTSKDIEFNCLQYPLDYKDKAILQIHVQNTTKLQTPMAYTSDVFNMNAAVCTCDKETLSTQVRTDYNGDMIISFTRRQVTAYIIQIYRDNKMMTSRQKTFIPNETPATVNGDHVYMRYKPNNEGDYTICVWFWCKHIHTACTRDRICNNVTLNHAYVSGSTTTTTLKPDGDEGNDIIKVREGEPKKKKKGNDIIEIFGILLLVITLVFVVMVIRYRQQIITCLKSFTSNNINSSPAQDSVEFEPSTGLMNNHDIETTTDNPV